MTTLAKARIYAAKVNRDYAASVFNNDSGFASHVTDQQKQDIAKNNIRLAEEIEAGKHDHNLTVAQRINYFITGESLAILP